MREGVGLLLVDFLWLLVAFLGLLLVAFLGDAFLDHVVERGMAMRGRNDHRRLKYTSQ